MLWVLRVHGEFRILGVRSVTTVDENATKQVNPYASLTTQTPRRPEPNVQERCGQLLRTRSEQTELVMTPYTHTVSSSKAGANRFLPEENTTSMT